MIKVYYQIEEEIPAENAIGGKPYWTTVQHEVFPAPWRSDGQGTAEKMLYELRANQGRTVRLVKITKEILT